jgi:TatA/E family protein of Tat protein translocase
MHPLFAIGLPHGLEWFWIALIVVLLFGADKLPKLARGLGKSLGEFKKAKDEFEKEIHSAASTSDEPKPTIVDKSAPVTPVNTVSTGDEVTRKM